MVPYVLQHMNVSVLTDQQRLTYISSLRTQDTAQKTFQERYIIGTDGERERERERVRELHAVSAMMMMTYIYRYIYRIN